MAKDENGNEIPGSDPNADSGQDPKPTPVEELQKQLADLTAATKKQTADLEIMREENQRLQQMVVTFRDHPGDGTDSARRQPPRGSGRFSDPDARSEFERKYSLPADAAEEIIGEAVSRFSQVQQEREAALRNGEELRKKFFTDYPDLVGYEPIVRHFSDQCANQHPDWTVSKGFVEVSRLSREYIKSKLGAPSGREEPPDVLPAGGHRNESGGAERLPGSPEEPARMPTQDEEIREEMATRSKNRTKAL